MDRHWRNVRVHVLRCEFRYYFREIQQLENARARLRCSAYSCAICDFCLHINPNLMMPWSLKHFEVFVCTFFFSVWPWEQFYAGTSSFACLAQIWAYMSRYRSAKHSTQKLIYTLFERSRKPNNLFIPAFAAQQSNPLIWGIGGLIASKLLGA